MPATANREDPALVYRFVLEIEDLARVGGFSECQGLRLELETQDFLEGGRNTHVLKFPTRTKQSNLTLKRGIVDRVLWDWYWETCQGTIKRRNGSILLYAAGGDRIAMRWDFRRAFPAKWLGPDLNATQNNVAVETLELCHEWLEVKS